MSQVIYSQPGWPSPFLGRGNSVGPPALSGVIMFSVKHNQSPRCSPLYKPRGPPINSGWLGDLSLRADRGAEASRAADIGLNPDADVMGGLWVICPPGADRFILSQRRGKKKKKKTCWGGGWHGVATVIYNLLATQTCKCSQSGRIYERINVISSLVCVRKQKVMLFLCRRNYPHRYSFWTKAV